MAAESTTDGSGWTNILNRKYKKKIQWRNEVRNEKKTGCCWTLQALFIKELFVFFYSNKKLCFLLICPTGFLRPSMSFGRCWDNRRKKKGKADGVTDRLFLQQQQQLNFLTCVVHAWLTSTRGTLFFFYLRRPPFCFVLFY
jgi:hypothetical protein